MHPSLTQALAEARMQALLREAATRRLAAELAQPASRSARRPLRRRALGPLRVLGAIAPRRRRAALYVEGCDD